MYKLCCKDELLKNHPNKLLIHVTFGYQFPIVQANNPLCGVKIMSILAIASDHAGVELKAQISAMLTEAGHKVMDFGTNSLESVDYPDFAAMVTEAVASAQAEKGILICGTGIGMSIAANRNKAIRAALCHNTLTAELTRQHNDANVLVLGARIVDSDTAIACVQIFLATAFEGGRHQRRINKLS